MVITVVAVVPSLVTPGAYPTALSVKATIPLFPTRYAPCPWSLWRQSCPSLSSVLCGLGVEMGCTDTIYVNLTGKLYSLLWQFQCLVLHLQHPHLVCGDHIMIIYQCQQAIWHQLMGVVFWHTQAPEWFWTQDTLYLEMSEFKKRLGGLRLLLKLVCVEVYFIFAANGP